MLLNHLRTIYTSKSIIGTLDIRDATGSVFHCVTLEPPEDLTNTIKPRAIPEGVYPVTIFHSPHFGFDVLAIGDVPNFEAVEIHPGNVPSNTHGCTLVADCIDPHVPDQIDKSRDAFNRLMLIVTVAIKSGELVHLNVARQS